MKLLVQILLLLICPSAFSQKVFRRHFIIAYDISRPSMIAVETYPAVEEALVNLFEGNAVTGYSDIYQENINKETSYGLKFFDAQKDEISFFHFNISETEMLHLRFTASQYDSNGIVNDFSTLFLKNKKSDWSVYKNENKKPTFRNYLNSALSIPPIPPNFGNGVSMSNFVYPLVFDQIDTATSAEEYILIILSDFKAGSALGNSTDFNRIRDIYGASSGVNFLPNSPGWYVKNKIDKLAAQYSKIDFFQYSFETPNKTHEKSLTGILGYKIKPKIGVLSPEDVALFVDGNLDLNQNGYKSTSFKTSKTNIKFTHNKSLTVNELELTIKLPPNKGDKILFNNIVAIQDSYGDWSSNYITDKNLMYFDTTNFTYYIPSLKITVDSVINERDFSYLVFEYRFKTKYETSNARPVNFVYSTERALPIENIDYSTPATIIFMYYGLPLIAILFLLFYLAYYGKPRRLSFSLDGFLDSFEKIDYKTIGKLITPYKPWNTDYPKDHLLVKGEIEYKSQSFFLNWDPYVFLKLQDISVPEGFEMFLKHNTKDLKEFSLGNAMAIKKEKNNKLSFVIGFRQNDITKKVTDPVLVKFRVEAALKDNFLFIKSELRKTVEYNFHIGENLNDVWVGFDPGTSGSCIAVGSATDNLVLGGFAGGAETIIDSKVVIETDKPLGSDLNTIPANLILYGMYARTKFGSAGVKSLQSIKKMLGYRDNVPIKFKDGRMLNVNGKILAGFLVDGLFKDLSKTVERVGNSDIDYKRNGEFNPKRAVVAIPNNFTSSKIQEMIDSINNLNQFKEVRYVYEAEAVLFYYLSNFKKLTDETKLADSEIILIFDMGGATINATVVSSNRTLINDRPKYEIDLLGKIGYGIGGDTIDYCLIKFVLSFTNEFPQFRGIDIYEKKIPLAELAFQIKKEIVLNYNKNNDYLITAYNLETFINKALNVDIEILEETSEMYQYFKKAGGKCKLFEHNLFIKIVYNNVRDAIKEILELSDNMHIDKVIFSGRSTAFPMIKETVEKQLRTKENKTKSIVLGLEQSKTAVALGACWYGINKNSVTLNNFKTNASFGFKKTLSPDTTDVKFYELVEMGCTFDSHSDGIDSFEGSENINDDFAFDGSKVNFYQVMGKDADKILSEGQKHKYSKIASIILDQVTSRIAMRVNENDEVECAVKLQTDRVIKEMGFVSDQEIDEANEEHYTWIVK